jgi:hypothetical protein
MLMNTAMLSASPACDVSPKRFNFLVPANLSSRQDGLGQLRRGDTLQELHT